VAVRPTLYAADLATALADAYRAGAVLVLEGPPDLIALAHAFGPSGLIAVPGTAHPTASWCWALGGLNVGLIADNDPAGETFRVRAGAALEAEGARVAQVMVPAGIADVDDWRRRCGCDDGRLRDEVESAIAAATRTEVAA